MSKTINPDFKPHRAIGESDADWEALKLQITTYLRANADKNEVETEALRALDPKFRDDILWNQIAADLGLFEIPGGGP